MGETISKEKMQIRTLGMDNWVFSEGEDEGKKRATRSTVKVLQWNVRSADDSRRLSFPLRVSPTMLQSSRFSVWSFLESRIGLSNCILVFDALHS